MENSLSLGVMKPRSVAALEDAFVSLEDKLSQGQKCHNDPFWGLIFKCEVNRCEEILRKCDLF